MQISNYSFKNLPFSELFKTYISDYGEISPFFESNPFCNEEISERIEGSNFLGNRIQTAKLLKTFNQQFEVDRAAIKNIERLKEENSLAIVTGQQLGIYGGPLYTYFKIISAIHLARNIERKYDRPVVPVFWLADEDHDYEEVRKLYVSNRDKSYQFELPRKKGNLAPVAQQVLPQELNEIRAEIKETLYDTDFSTELWKLLDHCFKPGRTFVESFGKYIARLFSSHGLVLAGSNNKAIKELTKKALKQSITNADEIRESLEKQSRKLKKEFHQQVTLYDSNLFYLEEGGRIKINHDEGNWNAGKRKWKQTELLEEINNYPERFSPNVFLRPILQDTLLPTIGYVAGPGEIAYYSQMKSMYQCFGLKMPIIFPRFSGTFIEPAIERIKNELPFDFSEYAGRIEDLGTAYVDRTEKVDIDEVFSSWKRKIDDVSSPQMQHISEIDPTLVGAAEKATTVYYNELDKLKSKVYRAVKKKDKIQMKRLRRVKSNLFPHRSLQERTISGISYMNKYGVDIWDKLLSKLEGEQFNHHKIIHL